MALRIHHLMLRCISPLSVARFWSKALERPIDSGPNGCWISLGPENSPATMLFVRHELDDAKGEARLSMRLNAVDGTLTEEIARLERLGATLMSSHDRGRGLGWAVLTDPEGNEFIVDSSDAEVAAVRADLTIPVDGPDPGQGT